MIFNVLNTLGPPTPPAMPAFNASIFASQLKSTESAVDTVVKAASRVGTKGGDEAVKAMKSIRDHPCESSPAPGCVTP